MVMSKDECLGIRMSKEIRSCLYIFLLETSTEASCRIQKTDDMACGRNTLDNWVQMSQSVVTNHRVQQSSPDFPDECGETRRKGC